MDYKQLRANAFALTVGFLGLDIQQVTDYRHARGNVQHAAGHKARKKRERQNRRLARR